MKNISTGKTMNHAAKKKVTVGIDLGDRTSRYCLLDEEGVVIAEGSTPTTKAGIGKAFGAMMRCRVALEAGGHSPWVSRQLEEFGHEVIVANPRNVRLIGESTRKDDRLDATKWTFHEEAGLVKFFSVLRVRKNWLRPDIWLIRPGGGAGPTSAIIGPSDFAKFEVPGAIQESLAMAQLELYPPAPLRATSGEAVPAVFREIRHSRK